jgi:hypothetical protein
VKIVRESVPYLAHQPQVISYNFADQSKTVNNADATAVIAQWLLRFEQPLDFFFVLGQEAEQDMLKQRIQERTSNDSSRSFVLFVLKEPPKFAQRIIQLKYLSSALPVISDDAESTGSMSFFSIINSFTTLRNGLLQKHSDCVKRIASNLCSRSSKGKFLRHHEQTRLYLLRSF